MTADTTCTVPLRYPVTDDWCSFYYLLSLIIYTHRLLLMNIVRDVRLDFGVRYRAHIRRVTSCVVNERDWFYFLLA